MKFVWNLFQEFEAACWSELSEKLEILTLKSSPVYFFCSVSQGQPWVKTNTPESCFTAENEVVILTESGTDTLFSVQYCKADCFKEMYKVL